MLQGTNTARALSIELILRRDQILHTVETRQKRAEEENSSLLGKMNQRDNLEDRIVSGRLILNSITVK